MPSAGRCPQDDKLRGGGGLGFLHRKKAVSAGQFALDLTQFGVNGQKLDPNSRTKFAAAGSAPAGAAEDSPRRKPWGNGAKSPTSPGRGGSGLQGVAFLPPL